MSQQCEDYPSCGHGAAGDGGPCPDQDGRFYCIGGCGKRMPKTATSSYCSKCLRRLDRQADREAQGDFYGSESY